MCINTSSTCTLYKPKLIFSSNFSASNFYRLIKLDASTSLGLGALNPLIGGGETSHFYYRNKQKKIIEKWKEFNKTYKHRNLRENLQIEENRDPPKKIHYVKIYYNHIEFSPKSQLQEHCLKVFIPLTLIFYSTR